MGQSDYEYDVAVIGAGVAGACLAKLLNDHGVNVGVFEESQFPRFSIGESLLPQCTKDLETVGFLEVIEKQNFQLKNGAMITCRGDERDFLFSHKISEGPDYAFQVQRAHFDHVLIQECQLQGVDTHFKHKVSDFKYEKDGVSLKMFVEGSEALCRTRFVVDASGFGRVLPNLLNLNKEVSGTSRSSLFCHLVEKSKLKMDSNKIGIIAHRDFLGLWYWVIPFSDKTISIGAVGDQKYFDQREDQKELFLELLDSCPEVRKQVEYDRSGMTFVQRVDAYSRGVHQMWGPSYVLLGNAGEFIDPIFSSGVTIACRSAILAAPLIIRELSGKIVDWKSEFEVELTRGINVFKDFVNAWNCGDLIKILLFKTDDKKVNQMICSILAGYVWDRGNPLNTRTAQKLKALNEWI